MTPFDATGTNRFHTAAIGWYSSVLPPCRQPFSSEKCPSSLYTTGEESLSTTSICRSSIGATDPMVFRLLMVPEQDETPIAPVHSILLCIRRYFDAYQHYA